MFDFINNQTVLVFDLDDTIYDEVDFVKSGFLEIANYLHKPELYNFMWDKFQSEGSGKIFNYLINDFDIKIPIEKLVEIYRFHKPNIKLSPEMIIIFEKINSLKIKTALISDGHYIMQKNKFNSLGLEKYIEFPVFTDFYQTNKPNIKPYKIVMNYFKNYNKFIYIADNPKKDFLALKDSELESKWLGIRYKNPVGIYKNFENNTNFEIHEISEKLFINY